MTIILKHNENDINEGPMTNSLLNICTSPAVIIKSIILGMFIGSGLTAINQFNWLVGNGSLDLFRMLLAYITPFTVILVSQGFGIQKANIAMQEKAVKDYGVLKILGGYGIVFRALVMGGLSGILSFLFFSLFHIAQGSVAIYPPLNMTVPAVVLPVLFGVFSQVVSFRKTIKDKSPFTMRH